MSNRKISFEYVDEASSMSNLKKPKYLNLRDDENSSTIVSEQRAKDTNFLTLKRENQIDLIAIRKCSADAEDNLSEADLTPSLTPSVYDQGPFSDIFGNSVGNYYKSKS